MPLFSFDANGFLRADSNHEKKVNVLHFQTNKHKTRLLEDGKSAIAYIVNHITAFERDEQEIKSLPYYLKAGKLSPADTERLNQAHAGKTFYSGALHQCLQNEAAKVKNKEGKLVDKQSSWDFLVETRRDGTINVVQCNLKIEDKYTFHAGPKKSSYQKMYRNKPLHNRDGTLVWNGKEFVYPGGANAKSIGIENSFYGGPMKKEGTKIWYPFNGDQVDVSRPERRNADFTTAEERLFERASTTHMEVLAELNAALCKRFNIAKDHIMGHYHFDPMNRDLDPTFTIPIQRLRAMAFGEVVPPLIEKISLKRGDKGDLVTELQTLVVKAGQTITIDGDFGQKTENAVIAYQRQQGLTAHGVVDDLTWGALLQPG